MVVWNMVWMYDVDGVNWMGVADSPSVHQSARVGACASAPACATDGRGGAEGYDDGDAWEGSG